MLSNRILPVKGRPETHRESNNTGIKQDAFKQTRVSLCNKEKSMNYQNEKLPGGAIKIGSTPSMTEETAVKGILKNHLAPKGKFGLVVVEEGSLQFVWEDDPDNILDADPGHPILIVPERFHHVVVSGKVKFRVEFYVPEKDDKTEKKEGDRPGEDFCECMK